MALITISAGWNANHSVVNYFQNSNEEALFNENGKPRLVLIEKKGGVSLDSLSETAEKDTSLDSAYGELHSDPLSTEKSPKHSDKSDNDQKLVEKEVLGWDGQVEIHRREKELKKYGWSKMWNRHWNNFRAQSVLILPELHAASPPELTSFKAGYERISENKYLDQIEDEIRILAEDCDRLEGFIYAADVMDGFSGVADKIVEFFLDEYSRSSVLFSFDEPWGKISPFSLINQGLSLLNPAALHIPLCAPNSEDTEDQMKKIEPIFAEGMEILAKSGISPVQHFLTPSPIKIATAYTEVMPMELFSVVNEYKCQQFEKLHSWTKTIPVPRRPGRRKINLFEQRTLTSLSLVETGKIEKSLTYNGIGHRDMSAEDTVCLWYNQSLKCATKCFIDQSESRKETRMTSFRSSHSIHGYVADLVSKLGRFTPKLTRFEQEDWDEKIEDLAKIRDLTKNEMNDSDSESD